LSRIHHHCTRILHFCSLLQSRLLHIRWRTATADHHITGCLEYDGRQQTWAEIKFPNKAHRDTSTPGRGIPRRFGSTMPGLGGFTRRQRYSALFCGSMWICKRSGSTAHSVDGATRTCSTRRYCGDDMMCTGDFKCPKTNSSTEKPTASSKARDIQFLEQALSHQFFRVNLPRGAPVSSVQRKQPSLSKTRIECSEWRPSRYKNRLLVSAWCRGCGASSQNGQRVLRSLFALMWKGGNGFTYVRRRYRPASLPELCWYRWIEWRRRRKHGK
jgi:hypothetical protein